MLAQADVEPDPRQAQPFLTDRPVKAFVIEPIRNGVCGVGRDRAIPWAFWFAFTLGVIFLLGGTLPLLLGRVRG